MYRMWCACVAACPNGAAMLFTSAKIAQYAMLPQGEPERAKRVNNMVEVMDESGFVIALMNMSALLLALKA